MALSFRLCLTLLVLFFLPPVLADEETDSRLPLDELRLFVQVFDQIRQAYVEEVDDETLLENAIKGLLGGLDPHSAYLDKESFGDLQEHTTGEFGGLGIEVGLEGGFVRVIAPIDDTPAQKAGIQAGDLIIKLDDQSVQGMSLQEAIELMRGPKGTSLTLTIVREGVEGPFRVDIVRDLIRVKSVRSRELEPGFGYVRIAQFQTDTAKQFEKELKDLLASEKPLKGVIIDLRNNPGGILPASIEVVDALVDDGLIVYTEGRIPSANTRQNATPGDLLQGLPVVVLINEGSASASEIVAGALQDHGRAIILGTQSFGKGSVQTVLPIGDGRAVKLTTARYFTPSGRSIQAEGIVPDILVERAEIKFLAKGETFKEENLAGHLENKKDKATKSTSGESSQYLNDNQLYEALNLLKGIAILSAGASANK